MVFLISAQETAILTKTMLDFFCQKREMKKTGFQNELLKSKLQKKKNRSNYLLSRSFAYLQQDKNNTNTFIRYTFRFFHSFAETYRKFFTLSVKISILLNGIFRPTGMETDNSLQQTTIIHRATETNCEISQNQSFL